MPHEEATCTVHEHPRRVLECPSQSTTNPAFGRRKTREVHWALSTWGLTQAENCTS